MRKKTWLFFRKRKQFLLPLSIALYFFIRALSQVGDYGMNWDSPVHFARGQAFLRYFFTGKTNYNDAPKICLGKDGFESKIDYKTKEVCDLHRKTRVSEYESTSLEFNFFKHDIYGHPPTSDLFLAASNTLFFKDLGLIEDVHAYHLYNIFTTFLLAAVVGIWVSMLFGSFAGTISVLIVYLYPLLAGEQQFNVKDPPMAAFFVLSLFLFWLAITRKKWRFMIFSAIAGGVSFGTKFNFVFAPFILFPWLVIFVTNAVRSGMRREKKKGPRGAISYCKKHFPYSLAVSFFFYPIIVFSIFYFSWPVLWPDPVRNVLLVVKFYQDIGGGTCQFSPLTPLWFVKCSDMTPFIYLVTTLPLVSLVLFVTGFFVSVKRIRLYGLTLILWITFFVFIIGRVTLPFSKTYGGLRQIIEFIGPFAMIGAVGAMYIRNVLYNFFLRLRIAKGRYDKTVFIGISFLFVAAFFPIFVKLAAIHPNENVYFNPIMGGLKGARQRNFTGYANTYGNAYFQAVEWLNKHAEKNSSIVLLSGLNQNIARQSFRSDITHIAKSRSGYGQKGEYQVTTLEQGNPVQATFRFKYASRFLKPLYQEVVEGVPLLSIWKNDKAHVKEGIDIWSEKLISASRIDNNKEMQVTLSLPETVKLKRIELRFKKLSCKNAFIGAKVFYGTNFEHLSSSPDEINDFTIDEIGQYHADFAYLFAAERANLIVIIAPASYTCHLDDVSLSTYAFSHLGNYE